MIQVLLDATIGERKPNDCSRKIVLGQRRSGQENLLFGRRIDVGGVGIEAGQPEGFLLRRVPVVPAHGQGDLRADRRLNTEPFQ